MVVDDARLTPVVSVADVPGAHRVLQCPLLIAGTRQSMTLVVGSRDGDNRGRLLLVRLGAESGSWAVTGCEVLMSCSDVSEDCVGVMPGDLTPRGDGTALLFNAYFRTQGLLMSVLLAVDLSTDLRPGRMTQVFPGERAAVFHATPGVVRLPDSTHVVYPQGTPDEAGGFPAEYHFEVVPVDCDLRAAGPATPLLGRPTPGRAMAKFSQDPRNDRHAWFSHRDAHGSGYQLGRCLLDDEGRITRSWWDDNGGVGRTPPGTQMLSYPEPLGDGHLLACAGQFGDQGLVLIDTQGVSWSTT